MCTSPNPLVVECILQRWLHQHISHLIRPLTNVTLAIEMRGLCSLLWKPGGLCNCSDQQIVVEVTLCDFQFHKGNMVSTNLSPHPSFSRSISLSQLSSLELCPPCLWGSPDHTRGHMRIFQPTTPASVPDDRQQQPLLMWMNKVSNEPSPKPLALPAESLDTQEQKEAIFIVLHQIPDPQIPGA